MSNLVDDVSKVIRTCWETLPDREPLEHEFALVEGDLVRIGISAFAVDQLGDIVFVDLPEVGVTLTRGQSFGSVESVKAVEDMYAPISGEVVQRNDAVLASAEELQNDPHGEGWLLLVRPSEPAQIDELLDATSYTKKVAVN